MPNFTLTFSELAVQKIQARTSAYNDMQGTSLTSQQWLLLMLKQTVIAQEFAANAQQMKEDAERDGNAALNTALQAEHTRLMDEL